MSPNRSSTLAEEQGRLVQILFPWCGTIIFLSYTLHYFDVHFMNVEFLHPIQKLFPAINIMGNASFDSKLTSSIWIYMLLSSPIVLTILFIKVKAMDWPKPLLLFLYLTPFAYFVIEIAIFGKIFNSEVESISSANASTKAVFVLNTLPGISLFCALIGFGLVCVTFILVKILIDLRDAFK